LDVQKSQKQEMRVQSMGIQNQDHILKRSWCFVLVLMLHPKCYFLLGKKIYFLFMKYSRRKRLVYIWL